MRLGADKEDDNILRQSNNPHKPEHITVAVSIHERSQNNNRVLTTKWNEVAASNYATSKDIAAAKYVQRKQFRKLWFLSCNLGQD